MKKRTTPDAPKGIVWRDPATTQEKIRHLEQAQHKVLATDWDGTVTFAGGGTWYIMRNALPESGQEQHKRLYNIHKPLEDDGILTPEQYAMWSTKALGLHVAHRTHRSVLKQSALESSQLREGAVELFRNSRSAKVANFVISASVKPPIEMVAEYHGMPVTNIIATSLDFDASDRVSSWSSASLVTPAGKQARFKPELDQISPDPNQRGIIVLGDNPHDAQVVDDEQALRLRIGGDRSDWNTYVADSWEANYDGIIEGEGLLAVNGIVNRLNSPNDTTSPIVAG